MRLLRRHFRTQFRSLGSLRFWICHLFFSLYCFVYFISSLEIHYRISFRLRFRRLIREIIDAALKIYLCNLLEEVADNLVFLVEVFKKYGDDQRMSNNRSWKNRAKD
ncbi:hypothetical protein B5X24_HaOG209540 [Helicoverpa armigera]|uniref:Uncharacterized protein n=1 Tax=Helicoverpa armigera TaxID=29058 RepID=A0A2W1BJH0_HELAM|nr:hypothetical protein B5X24_HaOG209540 [Helicoverpa armigera]